MRADEAETYHGEQIQVLSAAGADMVAAMTITNIPEAIGITRASLAAAIPVAISFTVETDGHLPTGESLKSAIEYVDAATGHAPAYYMVNCAHPTHFALGLTEEGAWRERLRGFRANASRRSHAELNDAKVLDAGDPLELGQQCHDLVRAYPHLNVLGGCCGTDHRHVQGISTACRQVGRTATGS
jgi:S-methylmethionine-dependent homocysteine/selenocysteine methylase